MKYNIGIFANEEIGNKTIIYLLENYQNDLKFVVCTDLNSFVYTTLLKYGFNRKYIYFNNDLKNEKTISELISYQVNFILLAWWPYIVKKNILSIPIIGVLNFHPSLLPYNRGRNYNFWTIIDDSPFGVTIHFVDEGTDTGDIVFQRKIEKDWTDTGETLYQKAKEAMFSLFVEKYKKIREEQYVRIKQNESLATYRLAKEMDLASEIDLDNNYTARELISLFCARTFYPHPGIRFQDKDKKYEIRISIKRID